MKPLSKPVWFGRKKVGFGISPKHPIGWCLTVFLLAFFSFGFHLVVSLGLAAQGYALIGFSLMLYLLIVAITFG